MKKLLFLLTTVLTAAGLTAPLADAGSCSTPSLVTGQPFGGTCSLTCGPGLSAAGVSGDGINVHVSLACADPSFSSVGCLAPHPSNLSNPIHCEALEQETFGSNAVSCFCTSDLSAVSGLDGVGVVLGASCNC